MSEEDEAGHESGEDEAADAELVGDGGEDDDEGGRRAGDVAGRTAGEGDQDAGDDGGVEAVLRRDTGGDGEGHGERQGDDADGDAGEGVGAEVGGGVTGFESVLRTATAKGEGRPHRERVRPVDNGGAFDGPPCPSNDR
jgi:hypothetical protein